MAINGSNNDGYQWLSVMKAAACWLSVAMAAAAAINKSEKP